MTIAPGQEYAADYARLWSPVIRPMAEALLARLPIATASTVLDLGTGSGALVPALRAVAPGAAFIGVDRSQEMLAIARGNGIPVAVMDANRLAFRAASFDVAVAAFVLFFLPDPAVALRELVRVLTSGAMAGTVTWGDDRSPVAERAWEETLVAHGAPVKPPHPGDAIVDSPAKMRALLEGTGFHVREVWSQDFEHRWTPDSLLALKTSHGLATRYWALSEPARSSIVDTVRKRWSGLEPDDFVFRPEIVFAVGEKR